MKIKHFQGYGCVKATKLYDLVLCNENGRYYRHLKVHVVGQHEYGLDCYKGWDTISVFNWLGKRFAKKYLRGEFQIYKVEVEEYLEWDLEDNDHADYDIYYWTEVKP